jgi:hypothetical protein
MIIKCSCQNCGGHLEFDSEGVGLTVDCPHCGMKTQLFIPQTKASRAKVFLTGIVLTLILVAALIGFVVQSFEKKKTDLIASQNASAMLAAKKAEADRINVVNFAEKAKQDQYNNYLQQCVSDKDFPDNGRSFETKESGKYKSTITHQYNICFINQNCLQIVRIVSISSDLVDVAQYQKDQDARGKAIKKAFEEDEVNRGVMSAEFYNESRNRRPDPNDPETIRRRNQELLLDNYKVYASSFNGVTQFRILTGKPDIFDWISTYRKWCQIALTNNLVDDVTNIISTNCVIIFTNDLEYLGITPSGITPCVSDVVFITPNILHIGSGNWSGKEVDSLEKLLSMIPDLESGLKTKISNQAKKQEVAKANGIKIKRWQIKTSCVSMKKIEPKPSSNNTNLFYRFNTTTTNQLIRVNVRFPMPAALAFLAVSFFNSSQWRDNGTHAGCSSRAWVISRL